MFGIVPRTLWSKLIEPDARNRIRLQTNCLLLDDGHRKVLVETGFGDKWTDKERNIYDLEKRSVVDALYEVNCDPADIDDIVLTHLHFDHAAGLTSLANGEPASNFPQARIHVQKIEWDDALANKSTMTRTYLRTHLDSMAAQMNLVEGEREILPGVIVWPVVGHTWGHQAIRFDDGSGIVAFVGDVMPTIYHAALAYNMGYDMLPYENMLSKKQILSTASQEQWRLVLDHDPEDPVVRVEPDSARVDTFRLVPAANGETR